MPITVLVVDDDPTIVHLLKEDLEAEGYTVLSGFDGRAAVDMALASRPSLIILDVNMPGLGGSDTFELLRTDPKTRTIPIVFLSGDESMHIPAQLLTADRVSHLTKPIELDRFNAIVRGLLGPQKG